MSYVQQGGYAKLTTLSVQTMHNPFPDLGTTNQVLGTNGAGELFWRTAGTGGGSVNSVTSANANHIYVNETDSTNPIIDLPVAGINYDQNITLTGGSAELIVTDGGSNTTTIHDTGIVNGTMNLFLPIDGTADQVLSTHADGTVYWADNSAGSVASVAGTANQISIGGTSSNPIVELSATGIQYGQDIELVTGSTPSITLENTGQLSIVPQIATGQSVTINLDSIIINDETTGGVTPFTEQLAYTFLASDGATPAHIASIQPTEINIDDGVGNFVTTTATTITVANGSHTTTITATGIVNGTFDINVPTDGTPNQVLATNGSGVMHWATVAGGGTTVNSVTSANTDHIYVDNTDPTAPILDLPLAGIIYGQNIEVTDSSNSITLAPSGVATIYDGTNTTTIQGSGIVNGTMNLFLPTDGTADQVLSTHADGTVYWADNSTGSVVTVTSGNTNEIVIGGTTSNPTVSWATSVVHDGSLLLTDTGDTTTRTNIDGGNVVIDDTAFTGIQIVASNSQIALEDGSNTTTLTSIVVQVADSASHSIALNYDGSISLAGSEGSASSVLTSQGSSAQTIWTASSPSAVAGTFVTRDGNANSSFSNINYSQTTITSDGTTVTLSVSSTRLQRLTGTMDMTYILPDATTLPNGWIIELNNDSTGSLPIQDNGLDLLYTIPAGGYVKIILTDNGSTNGSWDGYPSPPDTITWGTDALTTTTSIVLDNGSNTTTITPTGIVNGTMNLFLPTDGTADQVLSTHADGTVYWADNSVGSVTSVSGTANQIAITGTSSVPIVGFPTTGISYSQNIEVTNSTDSITLNPNGTLTVYDGTHTTTVQGSGIVNGTMDLFLPTDGTVDQVLATHANGTVYWADNSSGSITAVNGTSGNITSSTSSGVVTLNLATAGTAGTYTNSTITTDAYGRVTGASSGATAITSVGGTSNEIVVTTTGTNAVVSLPSTGIAYNQNIVLANGSHDPLLLMLLLVQFMLIHFHPVLINQLLIHQLIQQL